MQKTEMKICKQKQNNFCTVQYKNCKYMFHTALQVHV